MEKKIGYFIYVISDLEEQTVGYEFGSEAEAGQNLLLLWEKELAEARRGKYADKIVETDTFCDVEKQYAVITWNLEDEGIAHRYYEVGVMKELNLSE